MNSRTYENVIVWQKAHQFVIDIYSKTNCFPKEEKYGITSQIRRAAVSVPNNFVEGFVKSSNLDKKRFYNISQGSLEECHYLLRLSYDLGYLDEISILHHQVDEIRKLLGSYIRSIPIQ